MNEDYKRGYEDGQFSYECGHYVPEEESDPDTPDYFKGYDDGWNDAHSNVNKGDQDE